MINAGYEIERLLKFALNNNLIEKFDMVPCRNSLLDLLKVEAPFEGEVEEVKDETPVAILNNLLDYAAEAGLIEENTVTYRDLLDSKIMGLLMPRASELNKIFYSYIELGDIKGATDYFYKLSQASNYIMTERIAKNHHWYAETEYGALEITINLSKPEKDPKAIAAAKKMKQSSYPKCLLCPENAGYAGRVNHPGRSNHRIIPLTLADEQWYFQYSPYVYYNEHCIILKEEHVPMKLSRITFERLLDFVDFAPHYFIGSNADLPIVGGSILTHDHFQGGHHVFPMEKAPVERTYKSLNFDDVEIGMVKWPMSVIRLRSHHRDSLVDCIMHIYESWKNYSDEDNDILAFTEETPHNTVTPIARKKDGKYEVDIVLRNNRTSKEHPDGIFHPHADLHHIKKENIGLIEVMGLAVLPGRLDTELAKIAEILTGKISFNREEVMKDEDLGKHLEWIEEMINEKGTGLGEAETKEYLREETGKKFAKVLEDAGVYKRTEKGISGFEKFIESIIK